MSHLVNITDAVTGEQLVYGVPVEDLADESFGDYLVRELEQREQARREQYEFERKLKAALIRLGVLPKDDQ